MGYTHEMIFCNQPKSGPLAFKIPFFTMYLRTDHPSPFITSLPSGFIWIKWMKAVKVSNFHLDSPDRSISFPAAKVHPVENGALPTAVKQSGPAVCKIRTHLVLEYR